MTRIPSLQYNFENYVSVDEVDNPAPGDVTAILCYKRGVFRPRRAFVLSLLLLCGMSLHAQTTATASIKLGCTGKSNATVAIRWGHPNYDQSQYAPLFTVHCNQGVQTEQVTLLDQKSEFEVQTEGGIDTSYGMTVNIPGPQGTPNTIYLTFDSAPDPVVRGGGFTIIRSSGPNRYGEQNFRIGLPAGTAAPTKIIAQSSGDRSNAQMALRWGHPDFNDHAYFSLWTIKAGNAQEKEFRLTDPKSEFEIQTEGGEGTGYHLSIWFDLGNGFDMQPNIEVAHQLEGTQITTATNDGVAFDPSKGNIYGEGNVRVTVPWLPSNRTSPAVSNPPVPLYLINAGTYFTNTFGTGASGTIQTVTNGENFPIVLLSNANLVGGCTKAGNITLGPHEPTKPAQLVALYGPAPLKYTRTFAACVSSDLTQTRQSIEVVITYTPTP